MNFIYIYYIDIENIHCSIFINKVVFINRHVCMYFCELAKMHLSMKRNEHYIVPRLDELYETIRQNAHTFGYNGIPVNVENWQINLVTALEICCHISVHNITYHFTEIDFNDLHLIRFGFAYLNNPSEIYMQNNL